MPRRTGNPQTQPDAVGVHSVHQHSQRVEDRTQRIVDDLPAFRTAPVDPQRVARQLQVDEVFHHALQILFLALRSHQVGRPRQPLGDHRDPVVDVTGEEELQQTILTFTIEWHKNLTTRLRRTRGTP